MPEVFNNPGSPPVTDLPSGQPPTAPSGFVGDSAAGNTPDLKTVKGAPTAVIFERPPTPWPVVIKELNFATLSQFLTAFELGNYRYIVRIWDLMRRRDEHLGSVSSKRIKRVSRLDWEIQPNDSTPAAIAQAEFLSDFMSAINYKVSGNATEKFGLQRATRHLLTAIANSYASCEIEWLPGAGPSGEIRADLIKIRSDFFDESSGEMRLFSDSLTLQAMQIPDDKLIIHRCDDALMVASSILFVMKQIALGQWNEFCEIFGLPGLIGEAPDGASPASSAELLKLLSNWKNKLAAVLPAGYKASFASAATGAGKIPAADMVERCENAMSIQWLGGNLSTKSQAGSGTLAGGAQRDDAIEIAQDDAEDLGQTLTAQLCAPAVKFQFGQPLLCSFRFKIAQQVDLAAAIGVDVALVNSMRLKISEADVRAKYGWRKPDADEDVIEPAAPTPQSQVPLPEPPTITKEASGDSGTALKGGVQQDVDAIVAAHATQGRSALKTLVADIQSVVNATNDMSAKEMETRLKSLQGRLSTGTFEGVLMSVIESAFKEGSNDVAVKAQEVQG